MKSTQRGQVVPLFALMLVAIMAMSALAVDVSNAYASRRALSELRRMRPRSRARRICKSRTRIVTSNAVRRTPEREHKRLDRTPIQ